MVQLRIGLIVLTYNSGVKFSKWITAVQRQSIDPDIVLVIDSSSSDSTVMLAQQSGFKTEIIPKECFDHGGTRQWGASLLSCVDIIVYLTQDTLLADNQSLEKLFAAFEDNNVGAAYGRQLPNKDAGPIEAHARLFNYPSESRTKSFEDSKQLGIKTCFMSNSYAAYRCSALREVGGFPENNIVSEETFVAAKMLEAGLKIKYCAEATVYHSHNYSIAQDFQRYFDVGVFHAHHPWIREIFGHAEGEGKRFVFSEVAYLWNEKYLLIPSALLRTVGKYLGFKLGLYEALLPNRLKMWLSMQKHYWQK